MNVMNGINGNAKLKFALLLGLSALSLLLAFMIGSVSIPPGDIMAMLAEKLHIGRGAVPGAVIQSIFWEIRVPRALLAFACGAGLAVSGVCMQAVLKNPLASSYTLGVSSGAAVGASLTVVFKIALLGALSATLFGIVFGMLTVVLAVWLAGRMDYQLSSSTIILTGMAFSLFSNAITTFVLSYSKQDAQRLIFWQMGSFSLKNWSHFYMVLPLVLVVSAVLMLYCWEMDILAFGEEQAQTLGVAVRRSKWVLLLMSALLTGGVVSVVGVIGFVDLFTPHLARRMLGARHRHILPASFLLGGIFMVLCDVFARTAVAPIELPIGAVTSALGAPFFIYLYFRKRKG